MKPVPYRELEDELYLLKKWAAQAETALEENKLLRKKLKILRDVLNDTPMTGGIWDEVHRRLALAPRETIPPEKECPICGPSCTGWPHRGRKPGKEST